MFFSLIATDIPKDPCIERYIRAALNEIGFSSEVLSSVDQVLDVLRSISLASGHVDVVILYYRGDISSGTTNPLEVANNIRNLDERLSLQGSVKTKSVPILIVVDEPITNYFNLINHNIKWCEIYNIIKDSPEIENIILKLLTQWRTDLLLELECVGYVVSIDHRDQLSVDPAFSKKEVEGNILARSTNLDKLRKSKYLILSKDLLSDFVPYNKLQFLLNNYHIIAKSKGTKPEELFQEFFKKHPSFILRDQFIKHWAKPRLRIPNKPGNFLEPDFVLKPRVTQELCTKWEVLDIKLPEVSLTTGKKFHPTFSAKLFKAIQQLYDYREYFNRHDVAGEVLKTFGVRLRNPRLAILIGRGPHSSELESVADIQGKFKMLDIDLITYDEILESYGKQVLGQAELLSAIIGSI